MKTNNLNEDRKVHIDVTSREWDTMLAALRLWQKDAAHIADPDGAIVDFACEHGDALNNDEVDELIQRINCSPDPVLPIAVVLGGVLQTIFHPVQDAETEEESMNSLDYDLMDWDILEGSSDEEIAQYWNNRAPSTQAYFKKFDPADTKKFTDAVTRHKRAQRKAQVAEMDEFDRGVKRGMKMARKAGAKLK